MDWWQIALFVVVFIVAGLLLGALLGYLFLRFGKRLSIRLPVLSIRLPIRKHKESAVVESLGESATSDILVEYVKKGEASVVVEEQVSLSSSALLEEIAGSLSIATKPWTGELMAFQTHVWDTNRGEVYNLPGDVQGDLTQAYADMGLANSIVWLSSEVGRRSDDLDDSYMKLCHNIATALDRVTSLLKQSGSQ